jgi:hypothetical protein
MNRSLLSAFEESNAPLAAIVREHLAAFAAAPALHARFLNMLSLLEHIGSRKIMTCRAMRAPGLELLKHLTEESRHAFFFKRAAEGLARRALDYGPADTLTPASAKLYMGRLDAEITGTLRDVAPELPYLYMSLIVELRATWLYRLYQQVLTREKSTLTLKSILAEEQLHLEEMIERLRAVDPETDDRIQHFCAFEEIRFQSLWSAVESECTAHRFAAE